MSKEYLFIVDTNSYAGNFERQMCAYMTGCYGECEVGESESCIFEQEVDDCELKEELDNIITQRSENGCARPVEICSASTGEKYNSFMIFMIVKPSKRLVEFLTLRAEAYGKLHDIKIKRVRIACEETIIADITKEYKNA